MRDQSCEEKMDLLAFEGVFFLNGILLLSLPALGFGILGLLLLQNKETSAGSSSASINFAIPGIALSFSVPYSPVDHLIP